MPGLLSCAAGIPIPPKTIRQAEHKRTHLCKMLVGFWNPNPGKAPPPAAFSLAPDGVAARLADASKSKKYPFPSWESAPYSAPARARRRSTGGAFARQHKRPLPGEWGHPSTSRFSRFSRRRKTGKSFRVYHETLLATIKNSYRGSTSYTNKAYHTECSQ